MILYFLSLYFIAAINELFGAVTKIIEKFGLWRIDWECDVCRKYKNWGLG